MTLRLIGAGLGRTGTHSLKAALEQLVGGRCHHMYEVAAEPATVPVWTAALRGDDPDWRQFLRSFSAIVDWPGAAFWRELTAAFPDVPVLLSTRSSTQVWWESANDTIFATPTTMPDSEFRTMVVGLFERLTPQWTNPEAAMAAYEAHNDAVRATVPADRLFEHQPGDGWTPLCAALDLPEPAEPFPHTNSSEQFKARRSRTNAETE